MTKVARALVIASLTTGAAAVVFSFFNPKSGDLKPNANPPEIEADDLPAGVAEALTDELKGMI